MMERYGAGPIVIEDYDPRWSQMFAAERARIEQALGPAVLIVEHVGSTAVPGLAAKPIIDLLVGVRSLDEARHRCVAPLEALGYIYLIEYERWLPDELLFRKGPPGPWTHHAHLTEPDTERWEEAILVRDYLCSHGEVAAAYAQLKRSLAAEVGDDIAAFREGKAPFIRRVLAAARKERAPRRC